MFATTRQFLIEEARVRLMMLRRTTVVLVAALLAGCGQDGPRRPAAERSVSGAAPSAAGPSVAEPPTAAPPATPPQATLPLGGRSIFPAYRVVAYYGTAGNAALGVLGEDTPDRILPRLRRAAKGFATADRKVQLAYELIASVARASPGADGDYSQMIDMGQIRRYVDAARRQKVLVVLDLQPGRGTFLTQAKQLEPFLREPHVGLALDPEWRMPKGKVPGRTIGRVGASEVNQVSAYLAGVVERHDLPEKLFVLHQFRASMLPDVTKVVRRPGLATVQHVDGFGSRSEKDATWTRLRRPQQFHLGYKLFYDEDVRRYAPRDVLKFRPVPEYVSYQ
jgi:hypothetical protein